MTTQTTKPQGTFAKLMSSSPLPEERKPAPQRPRKPAVRPSTTAAPAEHATPSVPHARTPAGKQDSLLASNQASMLALSPEVLERIRKVVKNPSKEEVLYVRLSKEEKDGLADVSYTYKRQGIRTSDNEVVRVAINALLEDYKANGEASLLALLLASLHA